MTVAEILRNKGSKVVSIAPDTPLFQAVKTLAEAGVGSLLVVDGERIVGILTERDVLRENARHFDELKARKTSDVMTRDVLIGIPGDSLDYVMDLMTSKRIRHLPIMDDGHLAGIVSIGDVVKAKARLAEVEVRHLTDYILGKYPG
ncbi:MAG: CBS domain-containing protein [Deltaproteobacteria bacterium]|nr:CBS domain-containing protein [Deltaproteobacteria bacterium]